MRRVCESCQGDYDDVRSLKEMRAVRNFAGSREDGFIPKAPDSQPLARRFCGARCVGAFALSVPVRPKIEGNTPAEPDTIVW